MLTETHHTWINKMCTTPSCYYTPQEAFTWQEPWKLQDCVLKQLTNFQQLKLLTSKMETLKFSMLVYRCICIQGRKCYITNMYQILWPNILLIDRHSVSAGHCPGHLLSITGTYYWHRHCMFLTKVWFCLTGWLCSPFVRFFWLEVSWFCFLPLFFRLWLCC